MTKDSARERTAERSACRMSTLTVQKGQIMESKDEAFSTKDIDRHFCGKLAQKIAVEVKEDNVRCSSHSEPDSWLGCDLIIHIDPRPGLDQTQKFSPVTVDFDEKRRSSNAAARLSSILTGFKDLVQQIQQRFQSESSADLNEPAVVANKALQLLSVLVLIYFTIFLFLGILSIGIWLELDRPDIPRGDKVPPSWAGAFLATSAFSNNGMSLIDANMVPFQRE